jgi:hypothetical protein
MTQLSRPFQIVLVAFVLLVLVWFVALRGHGPSTSSSGSSASSASAPAPSSGTPASSSGTPASGSSASSPKTGSSESSGTPNAAAEAKAAGAPTPVYHGSAPGLEGLSRAINHAHGAVAQSQREAKRVENEEPGASGSGHSSSSSASSGSSATHGSTAGASHASSASAASKAAHAQGGGSAAKLGVPPLQRAVESELKHDKTVLILFWNPRGSDDRAVHNELPAVQHALGSKLAIHNSLAAQVGEYGTITHSVQVTGTPTIVIVNPKGQASTLTGLNDAYSIEQAIGESHHS